MRSYWRYEAELELNVAELLALLKDDTPALELDSDDAQLLALEDEVERKRSMSRSGWRC